MMKNVHPVLLIALLVGCFAPAPAQAHVGWWDWLEELSGPGPFDQHNLGKARPLTLYDLRVACEIKGGEHATGGVKPFWYALPKDGPVGHAVRPCLAYAYTAQRYVEVRAGWVSTKERPLFSDKPNELIGTVTAHQIQIFLMRQVHGSLALGTGGGVLWFSGKPANGQPRNVVGHPARPVFTPVSTNFRPFRLFTDDTWANVVSLRAEEILIPPLKRADFNPASTSTFRSGPELIGSLSISFDLIALLRP